MKSSLAAWTGAVLVLLLPAITSASPNDVEKTGHRFAVGSTTFLSGGLAGSLYVAPSEHLAIRFNVAAYENQTVGPGANVLLALLAEPVDEDRRTGHLFDVGAGGMYFPRGLWDGAMMELGVFHREGHTRLEGSDEELDTRDSSKNGGYVLVGWTWKFGNRFFLATALGASYGYATGSGNRIDRDLPAMETPYRVAQWEQAIECYMRVGFAFGGAP